LRILSDPRIRSTEWRDLVGLSRLEILKELALPLPWIALSLILVRRGLYLPALVASFVFFLAGLRQVHDAFHDNLGLPRAATEWVMAALSVAMGGSMHAVKWNHLRHHKHCMDDEDVEARSARMKGWQAIVWGPVFPILLHATALRRARPRERRWIVAELAAIAIWIGLVFFVLDAGFLRYHVIAMAAGQCLTAFFAVWTVHHDCDREHFIARTLRSRVKSAIALDMFFHVEHHLFPRVPTCHLPALAERLDVSAPELAQKQVY
jgi:fatty acid desaturase